MISENKRGKKWVDSTVAGAAESAPWAICVRCTFAGWRVTACLHAGRAFLWTWSRGDEKVGSIQVWPVERDRVRLTYRTRDYGAADWKDMDYSVRVVWTDCALGGQRAWGQCPAVRCGQRVAVLYGGGVYACRHCHNLAYRTQREQAYDRASRRAGRIRKRLGWEPGILNGDGEKPKGMHWRYV